MVTRSLPPCNHGAYEVLVVLKARKDDTNYVKADQDQREVACEPVEVIDPLHTPERVHSHHDTGGAEHDQGSQQPP